MRKGGYSWTTIKVGTLSADGSTYWNGADWVSALAPDGRRWNGRDWEGNPDAMAMSYGLMSLAISQLGFWGWLCVLSAASATIFDLTLTGPTAGQVVSPIGGFLIIGRRFWKGRWLGGLLILTCELVALGLIFLFKRPAG